VSDNIKIKFFEAIATGAGVVVVLIAVVFILWLISLHYSVRENERRIDKLQNDYYDLKHRKDNK